MSLPKSNTSYQGTVPIDLSISTQSSCESHATVSASSTNQNNVISSQATLAGFQGHSTYGIRVASSAVTVPASLTQALTSQISSSGCQNLQVPRSGIPLVSAGIGTSQVVYPRMPHPAFPQAIPISSALIGQQITLQRLTSKGQQIPLGSVAQVSNQRIVQHGSGSPGKTISPRPVAPAVISNFNATQHFHKSGTPTLVSVSQAQQIALRVPNPTGQQVTIQRAVSPLITQQISAANQPSFIQCLPNATVVSHQIAQSSSNAGSLHGTQSMGGNLHVTSPIGTATIVGSASHIGTAHFVTGQPISIQPRPPVAFIASAPPSGMTLTVTSIAPGQTSLQSSAYTSAPTQQLLWSGSSISQGQIFPTGIPVVLPRGALAFAGRPQLIQSSAMPRLMQKPLVSLSANCGANVTVQVPQVMSPVIKTVLQSQPSLVTSKDAEVIQTPNSSQSSPGVIFTAVLVSTAGVTSSSQTPLTTSAAAASQVLEVDSNRVSQSTNSLESNKATAQHVTDLRALTSVTTVTTAAAPCDLSAALSSSVLQDAAAVSSSVWSGDVGDEKNSSHVTAADADNISSTTTADIVATTNQNQNQPVDLESGCEKQDIIGVKDEASLSTNFVVSCQTPKTVICPRQENLSCNLTENASKITSSENACTLGGSVNFCAVTTNDISTRNATYIHTISTTSAPYTVAATAPTSCSSISILPLTGTQFGSEGQQKHTLLAESSNKENGDKEGTVLTEGLIDSNLLEWVDGVGKLPGTDMKFKINEFGDLELMEEGNVEAKSNNNIGTAKQESHEGSTEATSKTKGTKDCSVSDPSELSDHDGDPICCCVYCGRYGYKSNFKTSGRFCSQNCAGKRKLHRKQLMMSRMMMGMKKKKKKLIMSGEIKNISQEQTNGLGIVSEKKLLNFDWDSYLAETKAVAAPKRLFKEPFPASRNGFRLGMRLEGIDPKHQSLFCVLSVAEVQGYRLRLHFDGYSECYDFWVNADSPFIFPVGWAEKNGKVLQPPKNILVGEFNWTNYLKQTRAVAAPKHLFLNQPSSVVPSAFRVGMKLEAVDKKNSSLVCVATVADTLGDRILIHFDGWEDTYDYWCDVTSPSVRPMGWCQTNGHTLSSPPDYGDGGNFTWDTYLQETHSTAVPSRAFKTRGPMGFEKGMKVEVMDKRNPILIRVATIADIQDYRLLIHFDGWDSIYDYWIDDDSSDLHPPNWCSKTFHPLQSPIDKKGLKQVSDSGGCPTVGCNGIGHIKGAKYTGHHSDFGCPYSEVNMSKDSALTDRLGSSRSEEGSGQPVRHDGVADMRKCPTPGCDGLGHVTGKFTSHHCLSGCPLAEKNLAKIKQESVPEPRPVGRPGRGRKRKLYSMSQSPTEKVIKTEPIEDMSEERNDLHASIHESVFQSMAPSPAMIDQPLCWEQHAKLLPGVAEVSQSLVSNWTVDEVAAFVLKLTGKEDQAQKFREEQVDGDSFLLLQQSDLLNFLNIKLGPAIKIFNSILVFKAASEAY